MPKPDDEDDLYLDESGRRLGPDGTVVDEDNFYVDEQGNAVDPNAFTPDPRGIDHPWDYVDPMDVAENEGVYRYGETMPVGALERPDLTVIDWNTVQADNQRQVKDLSKGDSLPFWQSDGYVLIGTDHDLEWRRRIEYVSGFWDGDGNSNPTGTVEMSAKGSFTDPGTLTVRGSPDWQAFTLAVGEWSKKTVLFR